MKQAGIILIFLNLFACDHLSQKYRQAEIQNNWRSLDENGYSIQFPADWDLDKSGKAGTTFIILSGKSSQHDQFRENVNLLIQNLTGMNMDLNKFVTISEEQIKNRVRNGKLLKSQRQNENGTYFHKVIYTGYQGVHKMKFEQYYWIQNEKAYVLTLICEAGQFNSYSKTGREILNSFRFIQKIATTLYKSSQVSFKIFPGKTIWNDIY
jgi:hypothetical protein